MEGDGHLLDAPLPVSPKSCQAAQMALAESPHPRFTQNVPSVTHDTTCNRLISVLVADGGKGFYLSV